MSAHRFFLTQTLSAAPGSRVVLPLTPQDLHHAANVLRIKPGEEIEAVEPGGAHAWRLSVLVLSSQVASAEVLERLEPAYHPSVTLVQGVAKGDKMDAIVRQAVEIGADRITPAVTARCVVKLDERKRAERGERWRRIAKSAAQQSHRFEVPEVDDPAPLHDLLPALADHDGVIVLWEDARGSGIQSEIESLACGPGARVALVVGPEGGLSAEEVALLEGIGAHAATLGATILRTETAAPVALALALHAMGGLGRG